GFHPAVDDTDATDRELQITWTSREAHDQSLGFGYLILSDDPALAKELARGPSPADAATDVPSDAALSWQPGEFAAAHDVYFGTAFDDVNNATRANPLDVLVSQGQTDAAYDPDGALDYGQTYYWRVDEVNAAPDSTIFKGQVWSFTTESYGYPIANITATASASQPGMGPENTINGSGLDDSDGHSSVSTDMWMSSGGKPHWIQYEFDKAYKLYELWVWNSNQLVEAFLGMGAKKVTIEYSVDGQTWTVLEGAPEFARADAAPGYKANTTVAFNGLTAKYVRLTIEENWGGVAPQTGLSEVRFFYVPVQAFGPEPANGAAEVSLNASLNWRPGREAESNVVYFGTDQNALAKVATSAEAGYAPGSLDFGTTYFWKVDEVGGGGPYEGDVWSFVTQEFSTVDDMEGYDDDANRIYQAWADGVSDGSSGSQVGYDVSPFAEKVLVHGGKQSMPLAYDNSASPYYSEATRQFESAQNWTGNGASELCVWTRGYPAPAAVAVTETGGKMSLTGAGADIWNTSDEFTYAYKTLTGDGNIITRVTSNGAGTNAWAKGGVMIRDSINGGSTHATMAITAHTAAAAAGNGASFQYRAATDGASANSDSTTVVAPPYWVKIERAGDVFTGSVSADGKAWSKVGTAIITMEDPVLIGLAVTSHQAGENRTYQFEGIAATGAVTGNWQGAVIDKAVYNDAADMYVTIRDGAGKSGTVVSPTAALTSDWTRWVIPMSDFAGVNFAKVTEMVIGVGNRAAATAGGKGIVFIDDVGFGQSVK
ncbi:MAG: discoidin domain-containing protein, partial [Solirubrobacterales bacterium]